jgi:transcriptional regulator with XRE-family HTH domain
MTVINKIPRIAVLVEKTDTGFSAYSKDLNVFTSAGNVNELYANLIEALELYFEDDEVTFSKEDLDLSIDFRTFFQDYKILNARFLAERIGMNQSLLAQYTSGIKKPSEKQLKRILNGIHSVGKELSDISLMLK